MSVSFVLIAAAAVLIIAGAYLLLERSLTRILIGILLASNGVNVLYITITGPAKSAPLIGEYRGADMTDSLPMAMALTAIVITFGTLAYVLTLAYRSFQINGHDEVQDDIEDAQIRRLAELDAASESFDEDSSGGDPDEDDGEDEPADDEPATGEPAPAELSADQVGVSADVVGNESAPHGQGRAEN